MRRPESARPRSRAWFVAAGIALVVTLFLARQWWHYERSASSAQKFAHSLEASLTQFSGMSMVVGANTWSPDGEVNFINKPQPMALYDTITFKLQPSPTSSDCASSSIATYQVLLDAPGFTVDKIGDTVRTRQELFAPACSLAATAPPPPAPWRWNLMAVQPGRHVVTFDLLALDKNGSAVDSRAIDIPVYVPTAPESLTANLTILSLIITITAAIVGLWKGFHP